MLKITLVKSTIGAVPKHKKTIEALGLTKMHKTVELPDNAATRGMIKQVQYFKPCLAVQIAGWFIGQDQFGIGDKRSGYCTALLLPA